MSENLEINFNFQKEKITLTKLLNSPIKRAIFGTYIKVQSEFVINSNWNPEFYNRLSFTGGKKGKLKKKNIEFLINESQAKESLQFMIDFKLLMPFPVPKDLGALPDLETLISTFDEYQIIGGIEFDQDVFLRPSSGLKMTVGVIHHLVQTFFDLRVLQAKIQSALDELISFPSRSVPNKLINFFYKEDKQTNSTSNKDVFYQISEFCFELLKKYHPIDNEIDVKKNSSIFNYLLIKSLSINKVIAKSAVIKSSTTNKLKSLDSELVLKKTTILVESIILRELMIQKLELFFSVPERIPFFLQKLDFLSNDSELGTQVLKEANNTNNPLPAVFENLNPYEKPFGVVDDFLTTFSRLYISKMITKIIDGVIEEYVFIFRPKPGNEIFPLLFNWLNSEKTSNLLDHIENLVNEADLLNDYYSNETIIKISKDFKEPR